MSNENMTVKELIDALLKQPQDAIVWHEGSEGALSVGSVIFDKSDGSVVLMM
jgi:hypothetical protein